MKAKLGWSGYGDPQYVPHVLRYYQMVKLIDGATGSGQFLWPTDSTRITSHFGYRSRGFHTGIDIGAPKGTPV